jgi:hypothetical protein
MRKIRTMKLAVISAAVVAALVGTASAASAASVTAVSVSSSSYAPGATATYNVSFKPATAVPVTPTAGTITIAGLPTATSYSIDAAGRKAPITGVSSSGSSVTLTVPSPLGTGTQQLTSIAAGAAVTITATGVVNPAVGNYSVSVSTSTDTTTPATSATFTIGAATQLVATGGNNQSATVGSAYAIHLGASLKDPSGAPVDQSGIPVVFTVVPGSNGAGGAFAGASSVTVATGATGIATTPPLTANGTPGTFTVTAVSGTLSASFTETNLAAAVVPPPPVTSPSSHGYWLVGGDGGIFTFGSAAFHGSTGNIKLTRPVVGITPTADQQGYWLDASDGGVFAFGDAPFEGSIPGLGILPAGYPAAGKELAAPIVGMVPSSTGQGYFMVGADGGVFAFGDAKFAGSCPSIGGCSGAAVAVMPDHSGNGYWLVTTTGHVYGFGDAQFLGAPGPQSSPVTSAVPTHDGHGYWILTANGSVFAYGDAVNLGGPTSIANGFNPTTAIFATSTGGGYWVATANGSVINFGDAPNDGGMAGQHLNAPIIAATGF